MSGAAKGPTEAGDRWTGVRSSAAGSGWVVTGVDVGGWPIVGPWRFTTEADANAARRALEGVVAPVDTGDGFPSGRSVQR